MRVPFRQGLVRAPSNFIIVGTGTATLNLPPDDSVIITFADGSSNYVFAEHLTINNAWTGLTPSVDQWLYWDIHPVTGARTFGSTLVEPIAQPLAPVTPVSDAHWFDTTNSMMFVWNSSANRWIKKIRVFACELNNGTIPLSVSINSPLFTGTQAGATLNVPVTGGGLLYDSSGNALKKSDGKFFTTEDGAVTGISLGSQIKLGGIVTSAIADQPIPAYTFVRFTGFNKIVVATNHLIDTGAYGIVETNLNTGDVGNVISEGVVQNPAWDWTTQGINTPLYVNAIGQLTTVVSPDPNIVAMIIDKDKILLRPSSLFIGRQNSAATTTDAGAVILSVPPANPALPIAVGTNDPRMASIATHIGLVTQTGFDSHITPNQNVFLDSVETAGTGFLVKQADFTSSKRALVPPATGLTIANPDGLMGNPTFSLANDLLAVEGLTTFGIAVRTTTDNWKTTSISVRAGELEILNPDGVSAGNITLGLPDVGTPVAVGFRQFSTDQWGRVTATTPVTQANIEASLTFHPVNSTGDTMNGPLILSGDPTVNLGAVTKQYVDSSITNRRANATFVNADLVPDGLGNTRYVFTHNLAQQYVSITIFDDNDEVQLHTTKCVDQNIAHITFVLPITGTWKIFAIK